MKAPYHVLLTPTGVVLYANDAALDLRGLTLSNVAGKFIWDTQWLANMPEAQEVHRQMVEATARTGISEQRGFEIDFHGTKRSFDVLISQVWTSNGTIIALTLEGIEANQILNEREKEVLEWTANGKTSWEIAMIVGISQRTVEWHATQARAKLRAANTIEAVAKAIKGGLLRR